MWQRFTEMARRTVFFAQEEAGRLGDNYVSTEHLLLGLVREKDNEASRILDRLGMSLGRIRAEIERQMAPGEGRSGQDMQLTPRAKRVVDLAYDEARTLNNNYIGTEHLLLGLIREGEGLAARVLNKLGIDLERTRAAVAQFQSQPISETDTEPGSLSGTVKPEEQETDPKPLPVLAENVVPEHLSTSCRGIISRALAEAARLANPIFQPNICF